MARAVHPDLEVDEAMRAQRTRLMIEANRAYEEGDGARLEAILREWEKSPESVRGEGVAAELVRVIRKVAQVRQRLIRIEEELGRLNASEICLLKVRVEEAAASGRDLLAQMAHKLDDQILGARERLAAAMKESSP